ncbi:MAG: hypothetical protein HQL52_06340 [Magnetococcales bacterium]|nr:hypothetical protein [Magnetococcales bacterium]
MDDKTKSIMFGVAVGFLSAYLVQYFFRPGTLFSFLVGGAVGIGLTIFLIARARGEKASEVAQEVIEQAVKPDPGAPERLVKEQLTQLNERIRLVPLDIAILLPCEQLIDLLWNTIPHAREKSPGSETTFDLEQLATTHLPKLLGSFVDLKPAARTAQQAELIQQLAELQANVAKLQKHLDQGELHEFQVEQGFLKQKY